MIVQQYTWYRNKSNLHYLNKVWLNSKTFPKTYQRSKRTKIRTSNFPRCEIFQTAFRKRTSPPLSVGQSSGAKSAKWFRSTGNKYPTTAISAAESNCFCIAIVINNGPRFFRPRTTVCVGTTRMAAYLRSSFNIYGVDKASKTKKVRLLIFCRSCVCLKTWKEHNGSEKRKSASGSVLRSEVVARHDCNYG